MTGTTPMTAQDALWLTMDRPNNLTVVDSVMVLAQVPDLDAVRAVFLTAVARFPVLGRRAVRRGLGWAWQDDVTFEIGRHVGTTRLPEPQDICALQRFVAEQRAVPLDKQRPPWQAYLVHPLRLESGAEGAAIVARFHHAIADGIRLAQVMLSLLAEDRDSPPPDAGSPGPGDTASAAARALGAASGLARSGMHTLGVGLDVVRHPGRLVDAIEVLGGEDARAANDLRSVAKLAFARSPRTVWTGTPGLAKAMAWSRPLPLEDIKTIGRAHDATVNDVMLAAVAGGLRRYLTTHGGEADQVLWMVPVNLKPFDANLPPELGNHFALVWLPMPLGSTAPATTLRQVRHQMERIKHSDEPMLTFGLQRLVSHAPRQAAFAITNFFANKAVGILTNVPGPKVPMTFAGVPVIQVVGFAPCSGDNPMTATILSYNGAVTIGFATDAGLVPDPGELVELVVSELGSMQAAPASP